MQPSPILIKVGGNDLERPGFVPELAQTIAALNQETPCILVHGGGRAISNLMERLGTEPVYHNGQRVTDEAALQAAEMVLSGQVNKMLVEAFLNAGVDALGMSGVDRRLIQVEPWSPDMGLVGRIVKVRAEVLLDLSAQGVVPVISPISIGPGGRYNVNADHAAGAVAGAINARHATFLTNVPGVKVNEDVVPTLTVEKTHALIEQGIIHGGMIPKVNAALDAIANGVAKAIITDLPGLRAGTGTIFTA